MESRSSEEASGGARVDRPAEVRGTVTSEHGGRLDLAEPGGPLLDAKRLERRLADFAAVRDWERFHSPKNLAMALSVEASELVEIFQWSTEAESRRVMQTEQAEHVGQELADIAMYLVRIASVLGVDLNHAIEKKLVLNARKYPAA